MNPTPGAPEPQPALPVARVVPPDSTTAPLTTAVEVRENQETPHVENLGITKLSKSITSIAPDVRLPDFFPAEEPMSVPRKPGRPPRQTAAPVTWSVRGVSPETRAVLEQAANRAGQTLGQYLNERVRPFVEKQLAEDGASPRVLNWQDEIAYLRQLVENLTAMIAASQPRGPAGGVSGAEPSSEQWPLRK